jgi:hypothetical protein
LLVYHPFDPRDCLEKDVGQVFGAKVTARGEDEGANSCAAERLLSATR